MRSGREDGEADGRGDVTRVLDDMAAGKAAAAAELFPLVERELRSLAARLMRSERRDHTLQPTALVSEAWLRLAGSASASASCRTQFFAIAARAMRQVLVDHARERGAAKRGSGWTRVTLSEASAPGAD